MSIVVAVQKDGLVALAADSLSTFGSFRVTGENHRAQKIRAVGDAWLAATGWGLYEDIIEDFLSHHRKLSLSDKPSIFGFFLTLWEDLHKRYPFVNDQCDKRDDTPFGDLDASFLVANAGGIYAVASDMSITKFHQYYAIGSGGNFALGALHVLYGQGLSAEEIARRSVETAIAFNVDCGGEVETRTVQLGK